VVLPHCGYFFSAAADFRDCDGTVQAALIALVQASWIVWIKKGKAAIIATSRDGLIKRTCVVIVK